LKQAWRLRRRVPNWKRSSTVLNWGDGRVSST
jgi:hypothetical protein